MAQIICKTMTSIVLKMTNNPPICQSRAYLEEKRFKYVFHPQKAKQNIAYVLTVRDTIETVLDQTDLLPTKKHNPAINFM